MGSVMLVWSVLEVLSGDDVLVLVCSGIDLILTIMVDAREGSLIGPKRKEETRALSNLLSQVIITSWRNTVEEDLREKGWRRENVLDRKVWRFRMNDGNADLKEDWEWVQLKRKTYLRNSLDLHYLESTY